MREIVFWLLSERAAMPSQVFEIIADGKKVGITVARSREEALEAAISATTRHTSSKMGESCDYADLDVRQLMPEVHHTSMSCKPKRATKLMQALAWRAVPPSGVGCTMRGMPNGEQRVVSRP